MVESAGEVAEGETMTTPFGTATLLAMAVVTPEQSAPTIAATFSAVTSLVRGGGGGGGVDAGRIGADRVRA